MRFKEKVAIVTGSSTGIGEAVALAFGREGAAVVLAARTSEKLRAHAESIRGLGGRALPVKTDIRRVGDTEEMARKAIEEFGRIDILVNDAAYTELILKPFHETNPQDWDGEIDTTLRGTLNCCRAVLPQMIKQKSGRIINITTAGVKIGSPLMSLYGACKAGVAQFTKTLSAELLPHGILVNAVAPGMIGTDALDRVIGKDLLQTYLATTGVQRVGKPEEVAGVVLFLASDEASYITGQHWSVDNGLSPA